MRSQSDPIWEASMTALSEFVKANPDIADAGKADTAEEPVLVDAIVLNAAEDRLVLGHLGTRFEVDAEAIISISRSERAIANPFGRGVAAQIALKADAVLKRIQRIRARDLA